MTRTHWWVALNDGSHWTMARTQWWLALMHSFLHVCLMLLAAGAAWTDPGNWLTHPLELMLLSFLYCVFHAPIIGAASTCRVWSTPAACCSWRSEGWRSGACPQHTYSSRVGGLWVCSLNLLWHVTIWRVKRTPWEGISMTSDQIMVKRIPWEGTNMISNHITVKRTPWLGTNTMYDHLRVKRTPWEGTISIRAPAKRCPATHVVHFASYTHA